MMRLTGAARAAASIAMLKWLETAEKVQMFEDQKITVNKIRMRCLRDWLTDYSFKKQGWAHFYNSAFFFIPPRQAGWEPEVEAAVKGQEHLLWSQGYNVTPSNLVAWVNYFKTHDDGPINQEGLKDVDGAAEWLDCNPYWFMSLIRQTHFSREAVVEQLDAVIVEPKAQLIVFNVNENPQ